MARPLKRRTVRIGPGCQAVRLPSGWWHVRWYDGSRTPKQRQYALDTDDEALALSRARDQYERRLAGLYDPWRGPGRSLTAEEAVLAYGADHEGRHKAKSVRLTQHTVRSLAASTGRGWRPSKGGRRKDPNPSGADPARVALRDITAAHVRAYVYRPSLSRTSQLSYWRRIKSFFAWAEQQQVVDENVVLDVPRPAKAQAGLKHLDAGQIERLLAAVEAYHAPGGPIPEHVRCRDLYPLWARDAFELYATTGLRRGEGIALRWADVVWPEDSAWGVGYIMVVDEGRRDGRQTKTGRSRRVTMIPQAERLLRRLERETRRTQDDGEVVLKGADGRRAVSPHTLSHNFRRYCDHAKLPRVPLHGLRHSYCVELIKRGVALTVVAEEMGHADVKTTARYAALLPAERASLMARAFQAAESGS